MGLLALVALGLQVPRAAQRADHGARPELVEVLAHPARGGVLGGGDTDVVAAVVLDVEVPVEHLGQRDLGQPALVGLALVAQLVGGVDADAADAADRERQADLGGQAELVDAERGAPGDEVHRADEAGVLDRQEEVGDPAVVLVVLQRLDRVVRRVRAVEPGDQVDGRHDAEDHDRADPQEHAQAGRGVGAEGDERQRRHHEADEPQVALLVLPGLGRALGDGAVRDAARDPAGSGAGHLTPPAVTGVTSSA